MKDSEHRNEPPPGAAAAELRRLMALLPKPVAGPRKISEEVKKHLYGQDPR